MGDALDKEARVASQSLAAFVQLAKGFGAVTAMPRAEAISLGRCVTPNFCEPVPLPFLNQVLKEVESQLSMRALLRSLRNVLLHCADEHCAGARRHHNRLWDACHLDQFAPLVSRVVGTRKLHLAVGWKREGALLCASDAGAIVSTPKSVMAIESAPAAVLSPDTDLHVAWSLTVSSEVFMATSRGALVAGSLKTASALTYSPISSVSSASPAATLAPSSTHTRTTVPPASARTSNWIRCAGPSNSPSCQAYSRGRQAIRCSLPATRRSKPWAKKAPISSGKNSARSSSPFCAIICCLVISRRKRLARRSIRREAP